jgi:hypothetical protein
VKKLRTIAFLSIAGGVLAHLVVFTLIRIEGPGQPAPFPKPAPIRHLGNFDQALPSTIIEQASLFDSAPLFMPTRWNRASRMSEVASLREAPNPSTAPAVAAPEVLPDGPAFMLAQLGRVAESPLLAESPGPAVVVQTMGPKRSTGRPVGLLPPDLTVQAPAALWNPAGFHLLVREGVPAGSPFLVQTSGFSDWDDLVREFVASLEFYRTLQDGYYLITVFP